VFSEASTSARSIANFADAKAKAAPLASDEEQEILRAFRQSAPAAVRPGEEGEAPEFHYTGDLPRLFRFGERYQILEKLGEGGMGRVYKAMDLELDRPVALKTIRSEKGSSPELLKRFKQELVLARKVTHKNVIRIYDLGESEGMKFFTMELVEGRSVRDLLKDEEKLPVGEALRLFKQLLAGLAEAHSQGVVHRDLKPQNLMIDRDGTLRIMDFGIARAADTATMTGTSEMMGTPDYISPEQVKGENADAKSDLYSAGVILYELLTGSVPFSGDTALSKVVARIQSKPKPPRSINPEIPSYLERIVSKLMEIDPELRYQSSEQVLEDIEREQVDRSPWLRFKKLLRRRRGWLAAAALAGAAAGLFFAPNTPSPEAIADIDATTLAVLPFHNLASAEEIDWMRRGVPELLITDVSQLRSLRPVLANRIDGLLEDLGKGDETRFDEETLQVVSEMASADYTLHGSFVSSQGRLRLDLSLRESATGVAIPIQIDGSAAEVFTLVDSITESISKELNLDEGREDRPLSEVSTSSVDAYRAYQEGLEELESGANQAAIPFFERATELDPGFAMAHAKLAEATFNWGDGETARISAERATSLLDSLSLPLSERYQIHAIVARIEDEPEVAVQSYQALAELYPNDPTVLFSLAEAQEGAGDIAGSIQAYRTVVELAPEHGAALLGLGRVLVISGEFAEAIAVLERSLDADEFGDDPEALGMIYSILGVAHRDLGDLPRAIETLNQSLEYRRQSGDERGVTTSLTNLAVAYASLDQFDEANQLLSESLEIARRLRNETMESFALVNLAWVQELMGRPRDALDTYTESLEIELEREQDYEIADRLNLIGNIYYQLGRYADARVYLEKAELDIDSGQADYQARNLLFRARARKAKGHFSDAAESFLGAVRYFTEWDDLDGAAEAHEELARLYAEQGRYREALEAVATSVELARRVALPVGRARSLLHQSFVLAKAGDSSGAEASFAEAERIIDETSIKRLATLYHSVKAELAVSRGNASEAETELRSAVASANERQELIPRLESCFRLASLQAGESKHSEARRVIQPCLDEVSEFRTTKLRVEALLVDAEILRFEGEDQLSLEKTLEAMNLARRQGATPLELRAHAFALDALGHTLPPEMRSQLEERQTALEETLRSQQSTQTALAPAAAP
jgi:serine/threonine protein kinase/Tfp pilus assembly protein PilF